jgi:hypothetical protein
MFAPDNGPLWPQASTVDDQQPRCVLRLPPWFALPDGVDPADVRVERRGAELVLVIGRRSR